MSDAAARRRGLPRRKTGGALNHELTLLISCHFSGLSQRIVFL